MLEKIFEVVPQESLNAKGWIFMLLAMGSILMLNIYCFWKVFSDKDKEE